MPASFHPLVREWFSERFGRPTAVQAETWARVAAGEHVLALAPTGSGKTLAAFLQAISRLIAGDLPSGELSVLYISPLKALNEDLRRNLESPLAELASLAEKRGLPFPAIRAETRSGDTPEAERRRFISKPPAILCTTPESFAILLDSPRARPILAGVKLLVLDEIHALAGEKRGALLASSVGRLCLLAGEFQRIALSATVRPAETVASFVGGLRIIGEPGRGVRYEPRPVAIVSPAIEKTIRFSVEWPEPAALGQAGAGAGSASGAGIAGADADASRYAALVPAILERLQVNRSSLVFCDARRRAERLAFLLNEAGGEGTAYAHHGSLAKELRRVVEARLKAGELKCVVATASLELGIDVGSIDEVLLAGSPPGVAQALQRAGRSGHGVGEVSTARIYPFHGLDLLYAAAAVEGAREGAVEEIRPPASPLDILAQVLLALAAEEPRTVDALYDIVLSFPPFESLSRGLFDSVVELLAGRYADSRLRELESRVLFDRASGLFKAKEGARRLLYSSGGAIPDRGLYSMRVKGSGARVGELDEEFVWERKPGDSFTLGSQAWRIVEIGAEAVVVQPLGRDADFMPFWKGGPRSASPELVKRVLRFMDRAAARKGSEIAELLQADYGFGEAAAKETARFILSQREAQGRLPLPSSSSLVLELYAEPGKRGGAASVLLHTLRGGKVNEPLALVLAAAWEEAGGLPAEAYADDEGLLLLLPEEPAGESLLPRLEALLRSLGERRRVEGLLRSRLEASGLFAAQFRENAGRALLLPRGLPGKRNPLWITRLRAKRLYEAVKDYPDFPLVAETWRSCLGELFDLEGLVELLSGLATGGLSLASFRTRLPSPFARGALWRETNELLYRGDELGGGRSSLSDRVIAEALASARLRPRLEPGLIEDFARRGKRLLPGWAPETPLDFAEWVKERVLLPLDELPALLEAVSPRPEEGGGEEAGGALARALEEDPSLGGRLIRKLLPGASLEVLIHAERVERLLEAPADFLPEWLRREGAVSPERISALFGFGKEELESLLGALVEEGSLVYDALRRGSEELEVIDAENLEILLRLARRAARPLVVARPAEDLFRLIQAVQGLGVPETRGGPEPGRAGEGAGASSLRERLGEVLDRLSGYPAPAALWESDLLPARLPGYAPAELDALLAEEARLWFGTGREALAFATAWELELFFPENNPASRLIPAEAELLDFWAIKEGSGLASKAAALELWKEAWEGRISSEGFRPVREGLAKAFGRELPESEGAEEGRLSSDSSAQGRARRLPRALRERWRAGAPVAGRWFRLELEGAERDAIDEEELAREKARLLLGRYGILCRPLLERELSALSWSSVFGALRRMELAGEVLYGRFFEGSTGPQFMSAEAFELFGRLDTASPRKALWISALDPASPAAFPFDERPALLPARAQGNRLCLHEGRVLASLLRSGKELLLGPEPESGELGGILEGLAGLRVRLGKRLSIETVNGQAAADSPYAAALAAAGFESDRGKMVLW